MNKQLMDIECYKNYFCIGIRDYVTKELLFYEISEERNDLDLIYNWCKNFKGFLITFNGVHYDNMVIKYLIKNYNNYKHLEWSNITSDLKYFSDKIIHGDSFDEEIKQIKYLKTGWIDIDLFLYWSKMLRMSKKISLKSLGIQLDYHTVQELPFKPDTILKLEDLPKLRYYNYTHDLGILDLLTSNMEDDIKLRGNIVKEYGLDCWSWDAPKIASEALLKDYCKITGKNTKDVRNYKFEKPTMLLGSLLKGFEPQFKLPLFQQLWLDVCTSTNSFSKELLVNINNTSIRLTYGIGGLHSVNENEQYYSNDEIQIKTSDIASLYPNIIINYNCIRFPEVLQQYLNVKTERIIAKKAKDKAKDTFLKLILNSTSGLLDNQHSWLYFPEGAMRLRLIGQIFLTKAIEVCIINNWQVISANTDGIEVLVPKNQLDLYEQEINQVAINFNLEFEHEDYNKIIYKNVNNYICETKSGKLKQKGLFVTKPLLSNSVDELVIAKALQAYYIDNVKPQEFISNPNKYNLHIYDYCKSNKIGKDFTVYHNGQIQQQLNRYYFSKNAPYLFKQKNGVGTMQHINVGEGVKIFNNYEEKSWEEYDVNYQYYISKTQKIIDEINLLNQLKLF